MKKLATLSLLLTILLFSIVCFSQTKTYVVENKDTLVLTKTTETKIFTYITERTDSIRKKYNPLPTNPNPPTDPNPPSTGTRKNLIYEDLFERTNPGQLYASEQQWCCSYSVTSATDIVREGLRSVRMEHRGTDIHVSDGERVELKSSTKFKALSEVWYGYSLYFKDWFAFSQGNEHLPQWHPQSGNGGMMLGVWTGGNTFDLKNNPSGGSSSRSLVPNPMTIISNKWTDFVWHIKWGNPGIVELWIDGKLYYSNLSITISTVGLPYFKFGLNGWNYPSTLNRVFYMDALRIGNAQATYEDVAP